MFFFLRYLRLLRTGEHPTRRLCLTVLGLVLLNVIFGVGFYFAEREVQEGLTLTDSIWWAMVTMTTVGYGDYFPQTTIGRFFVAYPCFLLGISLIGVLLGTISNSVLNFFKRRRLGQLHLAMTDHLVLHGYPEHTRVDSLCDELKLSKKFSNCEIILVTDNLEELPDSLCKKGIHFVRGTLLDEAAIQNAAVKDARAVLLMPEDSAAPDDHALYATAASLAVRFPDLKGEIITLIAHGASAPRFTQAGLRYVWGQGMPDHLLAQDLNQPGIGSVYHELLTYGTGCELYLRPAPATDLTFRDLQLATYQLERPVQLLGLKSGETFQLNPEGEHRPVAGDQLVLLANDAQAADAMVASLA